ncbi:MAG TPA: hypothetical protein VD794_11890 [Flavisolibacter sp.]|nr:hypothetical protein [Flavisolibacter sp.]
MKAAHFFKLFLAVVMAISIVSCRSSKSKNDPVVISGKRPAVSRSAHSSTGHLPPGHAKKLNGDKSAKAYAPGQQKKKGKKGKG